MFLKITFNFTDRSIGSSSFHTAEPYSTIPNLAKWFIEQYPAVWGRNPKKIEMIFDLCGVHMRSVCYSYLIQKWEEV